MSLVIADYYLRIYPLNHPLSELADADPNNVYDHISSMHPRAGRADIFVTKKKSYPGANPPKDTEYPVLVWNSANSGYSTPINNTFKALTMDYNRYGTAECENVYNILRGVSTSGSGVRYIRVQGYQNPGLRSYIQADARWNMRPPFGHVLATITRSQDSAGTSGMVWHLRMAAAGKAYRLAESGNRFPNNKPLPSWSYTLNPANLKAEPSAPPEIKAPFADVAFICKAENDATFAMQNPSTATSTANKYQYAVFFFKESSGSNWKFHLRVNAPIPGNTSHGVSFHIVWTRSKTGGSLPIEAFLNADLFHKFYFKSCGIDETLQGGLGPSYGDGKPNATQRSSMIKHIGKYVHCVSVGGDYSLFICLAASPFGNDGLTQQGSPILGVFGRNVNKGIDGFINPVNTGGLVDLVGGATQTRYYYNIDAAMMATQHMATSPVRSTMDVRGLGMGTLQPAPRMITNRPISGINSDDAAFPRWGMLGTKKELHIPFSQLGTFTDQTHMYVALKGIRNAMNANSGALQWIENEVKFVEIETSQNLDMRLNMPGTLLIRVAQGNGNDALTGGNIPVSCIVYRAMPDHNGGNNEVKKFTYTLGTEWVAHRPPIGIGTSPYTNRLVGGPYTATYIPHKYRTASDMTYDTGDQRVFKVPAFTSTWPRLDVDSYTIKSPGVVEIGKNNTSNPKTFLLLPNNLLSASRELVSTRMVTFKYTRVPNKDMLLLFKVHRPAGGWADIPELTLTLKGSGSSTTVSLDPYPNRANSHKWLNLQTYGVTVAVYVKKVGSSFNVKIAWYTSSALGSHAADPRTHPDFGPTPSLNYVRRSFTLAGLDSYGIVTFTHQPGASNDRRNQNIECAITPLGKRAITPPVNSPQPSCTNDTSTTAQGNTVTKNVLSNDTNAAKITTITTQPSSGTATKISDTTLKYTPTSSFSGTVTIGYKAENSAGDKFCTGTWTVTVTAPTQVLSCVDDALTCTAGVMADKYVMANDPYAQSLTGITVQPQHGTATFTSSGTIYYTGDTGYAGPDSLTYRVSGANGATCTAVLTITVLAGAPTGDAQPDAYSTNINTPKTCPVMANDTGGDKIGLGVPPQHGTFALSGNTQIIYTPSNNWYGTDTFSYNLYNGTTLLDTEWVTMTVINNIPNPVATNDTTSVDTGGTVIINVLTNDTGYVGGPIITIPPQHGTATVVGNSIKYVSTSGYVGNDIIRYKIKNSLDIYDSADVTITVNQTDFTVVAVNDTATVMMNSNADIDVLANDDSDAILYSITSNPSHGTASISNGKIHYVPTTNYFGTDSLVYKVKDSWNNYNTATVNITVVDNNISVTNDSYTVAENSQITMNVTLNDDPGTIVDAITTNPSHGVATIVNNKIKYVPTADYFGTDSLVYRGKDSANNTALATVAITVTEVGDPVGPGLYKINTQDGITFRRKMSYNKWYKIRTTPIDANELEIFLPSTIARNNTIAEGITRVVINGITSSTIWVAPATMRELDYVYVRYDNDTSPPVSMSAGRHGVVLQFDPTTGKLSGGHYWINKGQGPIGLPLYSPTYASAHSVTGNGRLTLPKQSITNWGKDYDHYVTTGAQVCSRGNLRHIAHEATIPSTIDEKDIWINDKSTHTYSAVWVPLSRYFENASDTKKSLACFPFTQGNNYLTTSSKTEVLWFDKPVALADFPDFDVEKWLIIERRADDIIRLWIHNGTTWVHSGNSYRALWVNHGYTTPPLTVMPRCPSHIWDDITSWPITHINTDPPTSVDPSAGGVIFVRHYTQYHKRIYIPKAFVERDITERNYTYYDFTITPQGATDQISPLSLLCRIASINFLSDKPYSSLPTGPYKSMTVYFNNSSTAGRYDFGDKYHLVDNASGVITHNNKQWVGITSMQLTDDLDLSAHGNVVNHLHTDWINQSIPVVHDPLDLTPTGGVIGDRNKIYSWGSGSVLRFSMATAHTYGTDDRHVEIFTAVGLPQAVLDAFRTADDICVWDDYDTLADAMTSIPEYIDETIIITRGTLSHLTLRYVKPRVGSNPPVIETYVLGWAGYAYNGNPPGSSNFGWGYPDCAKYNLDNLYYGGKRIVNVVRQDNQMATSNHVVMDYTAGGNVKIGLAKAWITAHAPDTGGALLSFNIGSKWDPLFPNITKLIIDPRGDLDLGLNSELYNAPAVFDTGDIEIVLARDASAGSPTYTLHIVERIGDGISISASFLQTTSVVRSYNYTREQPIDALFYVNPRTDTDHGGLITEQRIAGGNTNTWIDTVYFAKLPMGNPDHLRVDFVVPIFTVLEHYPERRLYIEIPLSDIASVLPNMLLRPYTCFTNAYKPSNITTELPPGSILGSTVFSKLTLWSVRIHSFVNDTWEHIGDYRIRVDTSVPLDNTAYSKPECHLFMVEQECVMGFTPDDTSNLTNISGAWSRLGEITTNSNEYLLHNRVGNLIDNPPVNNNVYKGFTLPVAMLADSLEVSFKRKPVGTVGYITSARLDSANVFSIFITNATPSEVDFTDIVPIVPSGKDIYTVILPLRDVPSPTFHGTDGNILDMQLVQQLPPMTYNVTNLNKVVDGSYEIRLVAVKTGNRLGLWLYEGGSLIARTSNSVDIPWISSGTVGIHSHSLVPGLVEDRVIDLEVGYNKARFGCLVQGTLPPNLGCEAAPSTSEQSIHTRIEDNSVIYKVFELLPGTIYGYVHIDIVNIGDIPARVNLYRGKVDQTEMVLYKSLKPMTINELVEIHNIRVIPGTALFVESVSGGIKVRCSSIEELF